MISISYRGKRALTYLIERNVRPANVIEIKVHLASVTERNACPSYYVERNVFPPHVIETETSVQRVM